MPLGHNLGVGESPLSDDEFKELHRILQQAALAAYPNPERKDCFGREVLMEIAQTAWPANHRGYDHVKHCSPCLREMLEMRQDLILARMRKRYRIYRLGVAAVLVLTAGVGFSTWRLANRNQTQRNASTDVASIAHLKRTVSLFDMPDVVRGSGDSQPQPEPIHLPPAALQLRVILPRFSRPGTYQIAICNGRSPDTTLVKGVGHAVADGPRETVTVMLDLSGLRPGSYWLSTRNDDNDASDYFPVRLAPGV
jgi:hypothetical protein